MKKLILVFVCAFTLMNFTAISGIISDEGIYNSNAIDLKIIEKESTFDTELNVGICNGHSIDQTFIVMCNGEISLVYEATICQEHLEAWHDIFTNWC